MEIEIGNDISISTIHRFEHEIGSFKLPIETPILSEINRLKRIEFYQSHLDDQFTNVVFTDESKFEVCRTTKKVFVFKEAETPTKPKPNPNYSFMIWAAIISKKGKIGFKFVDERLN